MKKITVLTIVLAALNLNLSASSFDVVTDTSKSSKAKKSKAVEEMTTMDKFTKSKK